MKKIIPLLFLFASCKKQDFTFENARGSTDTVNILVKFKEKPDENTIRQFGKYKKTIRNKTMERFGYGGITMISVPDASRAIEGLKKSGLVEWAEPDYKVWTTSNDPLFESLWGIKRINAPAVWQSGNGGDAKVHIGIIDEGIMYFHDDLCSQVWINPFDPEDGIDNDGNGYIDDVRGWDFLNDDNTIFDQRDNHGTHVSGTIGARGDNGIGVIGVAPNVTLISGKFLESSGYTSDAIDAVDYFTDLKLRHKIILPALNNSWGGAGFSQALYDAIKRAGLADILFVASAGNATNNNDANPVYPCTYDLPNIISVAASTETDGLANYSNYGSKTVDIAAPGSAIVSTVLQQQSPNSGYTMLSGTSMASPHVTGAVAIYKSLFPGATYAQIKSALLANVTPLPSLSGKVVSDGLLNIQKFTGNVAPNFSEKPCPAVPLDFIDPTSPQNVRFISSTETTADITWEPSYDASGISWYQIYVTPAGGSRSVYYAPENYTSYTIRNLLAGTKYTFEMTASDKYGNTSPLSNPTTGSTKEATTPAPASITLTGYNQSKTHYLNWVVKGPTPVSLVVKTNKSIGFSVVNTATSFSWAPPYKGGNITYTVVATYSDRTVSSNSITLKISR